MALLLLIFQFIAVSLSKPFEANDIKAFSNPEDTGNVVLWIAIILVFTAFIFLVVRMNKKWIIKAFILLTIVLYKFPEWYIIDITGVIIAGGASSMFGISLAIFPTLILLVLLAVYDYIAVYKTKHMVALAEGVMDLRLPILFVIPRHLKYSFLSEKFDKAEREAFFMGLGDAVIPTLLVVSANYFLNAPA